jgi:two-component system, response regulator YesN
MGMSGNVLKVMIIDDERLVRDLLKACIDWNKIGLKIIGESSSAIEGLELVDQLMPDIIFADICMPIMDGLEFSKKVVEKHPQIKIIILTGHEEFEYAKKGIKVGISDFLLKPINDDEIMKTALAIKEKIIKERKEVEEYVKLREQLRRYLPVLQGKKAKKIIQDVKEYIDCNYSRPDMMFSEVAKKFFVNPSYLSRTFKEETGLTFGDYVNKLRMEKAIELFNQTDKKAYEIAEDVGISDSHYFSVCFKKFTGVSINEYKKTR